MITGTDFENGLINFKTSKYVSEFRYNQDKNIQLQNDDILITKDGTLGKVAIIRNLNKRATLNSGIYRIRINDLTKVDPEYLYQYLSAPFLLNFANKTSIGGTIKHLNQSQIVNFPIPFSTLEEQQKISKFLSHLDFKISIIKNKISTLKKYRKGIVQKLLNSLAKSNLISLDQLCQITTGKLDANAQIDKGKYKFFTCAREDFLIDTYAFDTEAILVSGNGEVGLTKYYKGKFNAYQRTYVLYDFTLNPLYLKACIDSQINNVIRKETNNGAMPYIKLSTFAKIEIPMISKKESNNIRTLIVSLNSKINCYERIIATINKMKDFLLNNLFI